MVVSLMQRLLLACVALCLATGAACNIDKDGLLGAVTRFLSKVDDSRQANDNATHWALLIAGSAGYGNYRHQADVAHAYQIMKAGGLDDDHIIVMMADDVAFNFENPHPGELYNRPGGPDVYKGVKPDYSGFKVNAKNFLAVLTGDQEELEPPVQGSPVVASGPDDLVFVYYADHGAPGILGMPFGPFLYADQLIGALQRKVKKRGFKEMVMFIEACESGSMFDGLLNEQLPIYVTTAANSHESSWGTYCPGMAPSPGPEFTTCLGDLYSVAWLEEVDGLIAADTLGAETLKQLYEDVKQRTSNNFTYAMGSHVMQYGNGAMGREPLDAWMEEDGGHAPDMQALLVQGGSVGAAGLGDGVAEALEARDAELLHLWVVAQRATGAQRSAALRVARLESARRSAADASVRASLLALFARANFLGSLEEMQVQYLAAGGDMVGTDIASAVELLATRSLPGQAHGPVVRDWECLRGMVGAWQDVCGPMDGYSMKYSRAFANLCNGGIEPSAYLSVLRGSGACAALTALDARASEVSAVA